MEESWRTRKWRATEIVCFRNSVCVLDLSVHLWLYLLFVLQASGPARASRPSLVSVFVCLLSLCWCLALVSSVVGSRLLSGSAQALSHPAEKFRDALLPSLPLTKKTLLKWMTEF